MRGHAVTGLVTALLLVQVLTLLVQLSHAGATQRVLTLLIAASRRVR